MAEIELDTAALRDAAETLGTASGGLDGLSTPASWDMDVIVGHEPLPGAVAERQAEWADTGAALAEELSYVARLLDDAAQAVDDTDAELGQMLADLLGAPQDAS
ncbi:MAG TPA: hypothetical protein VGC67_06715 [Cellulomonas sp.]